MYCYVYIHNSIQCFESVSVTLLKCLTPDDL